MPDFPSFQPLPGSAADELPRYDWRRTYDWNYDHAPDPITGPLKEQAEMSVPGSWDFCGLPVSSPLGIPAGPLLNGRWCLYYASLGFDVVTYKTVRSSYRACYPLPNLQPVEVTRMTGDESAVQVAAGMGRSWAVSFGMPSKDPQTWMADVAETRRRLPAGKVLTVSVVGTAQPGCSLADLAEDYARSAASAVESGADVVEANFSCPNVSSMDGQLYQQAADASEVAACIRNAIGETPFVLKIGHLTRREEIERLVDGVSNCVTALSMTNSLATRVLDERQQAIFEGQCRGICGAAITQASIDQVRRFADVIAQRQSPLRLIGVGGVFEKADLDGYLQSGAHAIQIATAAMLDPAIGIRLRADMRRD